MPNETAGRRDGERGAALITSLLIAMLMLAAGGALVAMTGMTAANAVDSTAEVQAYYAADAGLQAALTVIRRHKPSNPAGTGATFHNIACGGAGACNNTGNKMGLWLNYDAALNQVKVSDSPLLTYEVMVRDPSRPQNAPLPANYQPRYLKVSSVGRGPKGATKVLEMMVDRLKFTYDAPASLVLRESEDGLNHLFMDAGSGGPTYSGQDKSSTVLKGAVGVGAASFNANTDFNIATGAMSGVPVANKPGGVIQMGSGAGQTPWPDIVANAQNSRDFVADAKVEAQLAMQQGHGYYGTCPPNNYPLNGLIVITGTCSLGPNNNGKGLMVVTGDLTLQGSFNFEGLVFALGSGNITRNGGGGSSNGQIYGGILAARFGASGGFQAVNFNSNGGGGSIVQYDSVAIENALSQFGPRALGVVER